MAAGLPKLHRESQKPILSFEGVGFFVETLKSLGITRRLDLDFYLINLSAVRTSERYGGYFQKALAMIILACTDGPFKGSLIHKEKDISKIWRDFSEALLKRILTNDQSQKNRYIFC